MKTFTETIITAGYYYEPPHIDGMVAGPAGRIGDGIRLMTEREYQMLSEQFDWVYTIEAGEGEDEWFDGLELHSPWLRHCSLHIASMDLERLIAKGAIAEAVGEGIRDTLVRRCA
jgi:hypothetical protein